MNERLGLTFRCSSSILTTYYGLTVRYRETWNGMTLVIANAVFKKHVSKRYERRTLTSRLSSKLSARSSFLPTPIAMYNTCFYYIAVVFGEV